jgi:hypothetical protein
MAWELVKESIWSLLAAERMKNFHRQKNMLEFISLGFDEEKYLNQFELVNLIEFSTPWTVLSSKYSSRSDLL